MAVPLPTPQVGVCLCPGGQSTPPPHGDGYGAAPCTWWKPSKLINTPIFSLQFLTQIHICSCQLVAAKMDRRCQNRPLHPPFRLESHHGWCIERPKSQLSMRGRLATSVYPQNTHPPLCPFSRGVEGVTASQGACGGLFAGYLAAHSAIGAYGGVKQPGGSTTRTIYRANALLKYCASNEQAHPSF